MSDLYEDLYVLHVLKLDESELDLGVPGQLGLIHHHLLHRRVGLSLAEVQRARLQPHYNVRTEERTGALYLVFEYSDVLRPGAGRPLQPDTADLHHLDTAVLCDVKWTWNHWTDLVKCEADDELFIAV